MDKKDSRFSWKKKDEKDYGAEAVSGRAAELKGEEDFMQFSGVVPEMDEVKKPASEVQGYGAIPGKSAAPAFVPKKEESYISTDVVINGSVSATGNIVIDGRVNGDVTTENDITVRGNVEGNISAQTVKISEATVKGDVTSKDSISIVKDSTIEGNINGKNAEVNGCVHGNIIVEQTAVIMSSASVNGDITAGLISVLEGAVIKGNVHVTGGKTRATAAAKEEASAAPVSLSGAALKASA